MAFFNEVSKDDSNSFILSIKEMLNKSFIYIQKLMTRTNKEIIEFLFLGNENEEEEEEGENYMNNNQFEEKKDLDINLEKQDIENFELLKNLLKLMQLFCEGHNLCWQNFFREQIINDIATPFTCNFIALIAKFFSNYIKFINFKCIDLGNYLIDFLIESIQGPCIENQLLLCKSKIIVSCKDFLSKFDSNIDYQRVGIFNEDKQKEIHNILTKSTNLLVSLIEGKANSEIINLLCENLDFTFLFKKLTYEFESFLNRLSENTGKLRLEKYFDSNLMEAFNIKIFIETLSSYNKNVKSLVYETSFLPNFKTAFDFFNKHTTSIEIVFNGDLVKIFFPIQPICRFVKFYFNSFKFNFFLKKNFKKIMNKKNTRY